MNFLLHVDRLIDRLDWIDSIDDEKSSRDQRAPGQSFKHKVKVLMFELTEVLITIEA